ncbi:MAG: hypothetical protein ABS81_05210 [Pseudonocardia sp. SCN 72-86]|nr:MAG: hypothetical protein ABS81_05210 [Pseudonocardia sp. SCN 72-86]
MYRCFPAKSELVSAAVNFHVASVLGRQRSSLLEVASLADLRAWASDLVGLSSADSRESVLLHGSLVTELAGGPDDLRAALDDAFRTWQSYLAAALSRIQERGELHLGADPCELAAGIVAVVQGGLILAQVEDAKPLQAALDLSLASLARVAPPSAGRAPG